MNKQNERSQTKQFWTAKYSKKKNRRRQNIRNIIES